MIETLEIDNRTLTLSLHIAYKAAEDAGEIGVSNALQDRIQQHQKWGWMLRSLTKE
jgi:DNA-binding ferritin-like protein